MDEVHKSGTRSHRTLWLLVVSGIVWVLMLLALLAWWLLPRWAPEFVIQYAPMPDMVFRAAIDDDDLTTDASERLIAMGTRATPTMMAQLHHSDEKARSLALTVLGELKDPQAIEAVAAVLNDPQESLQLSAMEALGQIGDARAIPYLLPLLSHNTLSYEAASALSALPGTAVADALRPLIEQRQNYAVLFALCDNRDPRVLGWLDTEMRRLITDDSSDADWPDVAASVLAKGDRRWGGRDLLMTAMVDASPIVRERSVQALGYNVPPLSEEERTLTLRLLSDPDTNVIAATVQVCNGHGLEAAIPTLLRFLDSPDPALRAAATRGFGYRLLDEQATLRLMLMTTDPHEQIRIGAVSSLGRVARHPDYKGSSLTPVLLAALADVSPWVRKSALFGLGKLHDPQGTAGIVALLDDPDAGVRSEALKQATGFYRMLTDAQRAKVNAAREKILVSTP